MYRKLLIVSLAAFLLFLISLIPSASFAFDLGSVLNQMANQIKNSQTNNAQSQYPQAQPQQAINSNYNMRSPGEYCSTIQSDPTIKEFVKFSNRVIAGNVAWDLTKGQDKDGQLKKFVSDNLSNPKKNGMDLINSISRTVNQCISKLVDTSYISFFYNGKISKDKIDKFRDEIHKGINETTRTYNGVSYFSNESMKLMPLIGYMHPAGESHSDEAGVSYYDLYVVALAFKGGEDLLKKVVLPQIESDNEQLTRQLAEEDSRRLEYKKFQQELDKENIELSRESAKIRASGALGIKNYVLGVPRNYYSYQLINAKFECSKFKFNSGRELLELCSGSQETRIKTTVANMSAFVSSLGFENGKLSYVHFYITPDRQVTDAIVQKFGKQNIKFARLQYYGDNTFLQLSDHFQYVGYPTNKIYPWEFSTPEKLCQMSGVPTVVWWNLGGGKLSLIGCLSTLPTAIPLLVSERYTDLYVAKNGFAKKLQTAVKRHYENKLKERANKNANDL